MKRIIAYLLAVFMIASVVMSCVSCDVSSIVNQLLEDPASDVEDTENDETTKKSKDTEQTSEEYEETSMGYVEDTTELTPPGDLETNTSWDTTPTYDTDHPVEPPIDNPVEPPVDVELPNYGLDFGADELNILTVRPKSGVNATRYFMPESNSSQVISELSYERDMMISEMLNLNIGYIFESDTLTCSETFRNHIMVNDTSIDVYAPGFNGEIGSLTINGYLTDISSLPYVDLDASYWNKDLMDDMTLNGKYYAGVGNMMMPDTQVILFNKMLTEQYGFSSEEFYSAVYSECWTLEKFYEYTKYFDNDLNGDGMMDKNDMIGLIATSNMSFVDLMYASDISFTEKNPDTDKFELTYLSNNEKMHQFIERIRCFPNSQSTYFVSQSESINIFKKGTAAFTLASVSRLYEYVDCDDFGILPLPKYDMNQKEYTSLYRGGMLCVPYNVENPDMVGAALEYLNAYSTGIKDTYYMQVLRSEEDMTMLNMATENLVGEFINTYAYSDSAIKNYVNNMYTHIIEKGEALEAFFQQNRYAVNTIIQSLQQ